ncbi:MAG TPA: hypothetical protein H9671_05995 [Firmicutes bacterium]|nr:hypothetical protein [Bacillota bacterium]
MSEQEKSQFEKELAQEQQYQRELVEMKKIKQGQIENPYESSAHVPHTPEAPKTFWGKIQNFFYHYKGVVAVVSFLVVAGGVILWNFFSRPVYDLQVVAATRYDLSLVSDQLAQTLAAYTTDTNGDGEIHVLVDAMQITQDTTGIQLQQQITNQTKLMGSFATADSVIYLLDDTVYEFLQESADIFEDLSGQYDSPYIEADRFYIAGTDFAAEAALENFFELLYGETVPDDLSFCLREASPDFSDAERLAQTYEKDKPVLDRLVSGEKVADQ